MDHASPVPSQTRCGRCPGGPPNLQGETLTKDRHIRPRFPVPFNAADIHAGLAYVVLTIMLETDVALFSGPIGLGLCTILHLNF